MAVIVGVHGISQQRSGPMRQSKRWSDAFMRGMKYAGCPPDQVPTLAVAFYGHLFRKGSPYLGELEDQQWQDDETAFVAGALSELTAGMSAEEVDQLVRAAQLLGLPRFLPPAVLRGLAAVDKKWGTGRGLLLAWDLRQVHAYLHVPQAGEEIRAIVTEAVSVDTRVLLGHSLGSVVVYDLLVRGALPHIRGLVTVGSPLPLHTVWSALPEAGNVLRDVLWLNIYDSWDVVTLGHGMAPHAEDIPVTNRRGDPHAITQYLAQQDTASAILRAVRA